MSLETWPALSMTSPAKLPSHCTMTALGLQVWERAGLPPPQGNMQATSVHTSHQVQSCGSNLWQAEALAPRALGSLGQ